MKQYPTVLRERLLCFLDAGHSHAEAARTFGVSLSSIARWRQRAAAADLAPSTRPGRPRRIDGDHAPALAAQVAAAPDATLAEPCTQWARTQGMVVSGATMSRALHRLGITVKKNAVRE